MLMWRDAVRKWKTKGSLDSRILGLPFIRRFASFKRSKRSPLLSNTHWLQIHSQPRVCSPPRADQEVAPPPPPHSYSKKSLASPIRPREAEKEVASPILAGLQIHSQQGFARLPFGARSRSPPHSHLQVIPDPMFRKAFRRAGDFSTATANSRRNPMISDSRVPAETADAVVIGAGVVGLAVARELALKGRDVLVLEASSTFGTRTSSRNSEVIHAGLYYPPQSLKAVLCIKGRELLYKYCSDRGIPHKQLGKLIVATSASDISKLDQIVKRGMENGVKDLRMVDGSLALEMEPELQCVKALLSPSSGIIDSHAFMLSLVGEAESFRTTISYNTVVIGGQVVNNSMQLQISESKDLEVHAGDSAFQPQLVIIPKIVINSAGLSALHLAKRFQGLKQRFIPASYFARGCYFTLCNTKSPFSRLIYPIPEDGGLGVHASLDLNGLVKFGPDVEWIDDLDGISSFLNRFDYSVNSDRSSRFYPEIRKYFPNLRDGSLEPGYSGIRPKLSGQGQIPSDFVIQGENTHGIPGLINLFGIESPGLTSSLAIADYIVSNFVN